MIIRVKPYKDAFTFGGLVKKNTGLDEILEIGHSDLQGAEGSSRAFLSFRLPLLSTYRKVAHRVILNLKEVHSENLTSPCILKVYKVSDDWLEGTGHISDDPNIEDGINRETEPAESTFIGDIEFTPENDVLDIKLDITKLVDSLLFQDTVSLMIRFADEELADSVGSRIMYYSKDTHTCSWPYLDFEIDDSLQDSKDLEEVQKGSIRLIVQNLQTRYRKGEQYRINVNAIPAYPIRQFSTSSIYRKNYRVPTGLTYGIVDEYTRETIIEAKNNLGTIISSDNSGSFFILNTNELEPERYYYLEFALPESSISKYQILDNRYTFRIDR